MMSSETNSSDSGRKYKPFLWVGLIWLVLGLSVAFVMPGAYQEKISRVRWVLFLWFLVITDLIALIALVSAAFEWFSGNTKNQTYLIIRTSSWVTIKLACLGTLGWVLYSGRNIPVVALIFGVGTMTVVPILGGVQRN